MKKFRKPFLFALALVPIAAIGSALVGVYSMESYTPEMTQEIISQVGSMRALLLISAAQGVVYAFVFGFIGYILSKKIGLMKPFRFEKKPFLRSLVITTVCGVLFSMDRFVFGGLIPQVSNYYAEGISTANFFGSLLYGGIIEEVLMRLFLMSLIAFILWKLFAKKYTCENIPKWIFISANIVSAILFAAGHIPATISMFGELTPLILLRCFLLNGALGIVFGWLYRKYGIQYAMLGHFGCHLISKLILMVLF